jgi:hypothetical protein
MDIWELDLATSGGLVNCGSGGRGGNFEGAGDDSRADLVVNRVISSTRVIANSFVAAWSSSNLALSKVCGSIKSSKS